jgi:rare lipoprotein A
MSEAWTVGVQSKVASCDTHLIEGYNMNSTKLLLCALAGMAATGLVIAQSPNVSAPATTQAPSPAPAAPAITSAPAGNATTSADAMEGLAAVYSDKLNGHKTASGQVFRQSELTAAHPTLAFGTKVKVTNTKNQKSVEVRINDRGPKQTGRVIDLSSAAAAKLGIGKKGTAPVKLEVVG